MDRKLLIRTSLNLPDLYRSVIKYDYYFENKIIDRFPMISDVRSFKVLKDDRLFIITDMGYGVIKSRDKEYYISDEIQSIADILELSDNKLAILGTEDNLIGI